MTTPPLAVADLVEASLKMTGLDVKLGAALFQRANVTSCCLIATREEKPQST